MKKLTRELILKIFETNMNKIQKYGVKTIGLFGSYSTNKANDKSDIDILVGFDKGQKTFDNYMDLKFFLEDLFHLSFSTRILSL